MSGRLRLGVVVSIGLAVALAGPIAPSAAAPARTAAVPAMAAGASAPQVPQGRKARSLTVQVRGLHSGVRAHVKVTGPSGFRRKVTRSQVLPDLRPGRYKVRAKDVVVRGGHMTPVVSRSRLRVSRTDGARVRVTYQHLTVDDLTQDDATGTDPAAPVTVADVTPRWGVDAGGTVVTIVGAGFAPDSTVALDGVAATILARTATTLEVVTPPHPEQTVDVTVTGTGGQVATLPAAFTFLPPSTPGDWRSGASGRFAANGQFGSWRGTALEIGGTWNDSFDGQVNQWTLQAGSEWNGWSGDLDVAFGAIYKDRGETWGRAAKGAYDDRWATGLGAIAAARAGRSGTVYLRFAHEFNGEWVPWSVTGDEVAAFQKAWKRFRKLQRSILPTARLVLCPNSGTSASLSLDWRTAFPGSDVVDVLGVDVYNSGMVARTSAEFDARSLRVDGYGAPLGLEAHRLFAESVGLPFAVPEWGSDGDVVDAPEIAERFHEWVAYFAGDGPGRVLYEIMFNVAAFGNGRYQLYPATRQPQFAARYVELF